MRLPPTISLLGRQICARWTGFKTVRSEISPKGPLSLSLEGQGAAYDGRVKLHKGFRAIELRFASLRGLRAIGRCLRSDSARTDMRDYFFFLAVEPSDFDGAVLDSAGFSDDFSDDFSEAPAPSPDFSFEEPPGFFPA